MIKFDFIHRLLSEEIDHIDIDFYEDKTIKLRRFGWSIVFVRQKDRWYRIAYDEYNKEGKSCNIDNAYYCDDFKERIKKDIELLRPSKYYDNGCNFK